MSAFLCSDRHLATIAYNIALEAGRDLAFTQDLANRLKAINTRTVAARCGKKPIVRKCVTAGNMEVMGKHDTTALIVCWKYQSDNPACLEYLMMAAYLEAFVRKINGIASQSKIWSI